MPTKRGFCVAALALGVLGACQAGAQAQSPRVRRQAPSFMSRPTVSPYLNLLRPNGGPLPNYYSLVRPEIEARAGINRNAQSLNNLQSQVRGLEQNQRSLGQNEIRTTGHSTFFMNTQNFFPQQGFGR
jgi:hypothetical protein